jgi:hypothetical protein
MDVISALKYLVLWSSLATQAKFVKENKNFEIFLCVEMYSPVFTSFLGAFAKLRKVTVKWSSLSIHLSVRLCAWNTSASKWTVFH